MIVVCSGCSAKFRVADEKVGLRGAKLRCSKCRTVFTVQRPIEVPEPEPPAPPEPAADPFAEAQRRPVPPPLPRRPTTLDARAAFEVDLEPHLGAPPAPADPFAPPPPAPAPPLDADPFAAAASIDPGIPGSDPFLAPEEAPFQFPVPSGLGEADPFAGAGPAAPAAEDGSGAPDGTLGGFGRGAPGGVLSLEELTTPPGRRMAPARPARVADEPADAGVTSDSLLPDLDAGVLATATAPAASLPRGLPAPSPVPEPEPSLQLDPFAAAAVAADPLAVDQPAWAAAPHGSSEPTSERRVAVRSFRLRDLLVSALALAALLLLALVILVVWRGGLSTADAFRPSAVLAVLAHRPPAGALLATGVTSGLYERARGAPLLFVRGTVTSTSAAPLEGVRVIVEVVRGDAVLARGEAPAGALPGPEALHGVTDAASLARALAEAAGPGRARLAPGGSAPFLIAFIEEPAGLAGATLRVRPVTGGE